MTDLKVGDRVLLSTGVEVEVTDIHLESGKEIDFLMRLPDREYISSPRLQSLGISWELVKPQLVEPPVGSVIRVKNSGNEYQIVVRDPNYGWCCPGDERGGDWKEIVEGFNLTEYELLRPEKEVVKEVLEAVRKQETRYIAEAVTFVSEEYGV